MNKRIGKLVVYIIAASLILAFSFSNMNSISKKTEITYTEFIELAEEGEVEKVVIDGEILKIYPYNSNDYYTTKYIDNKELLDFCDEQSVIINAEIEEENTFTDIIISLIVSILPFFFIFWLFSTMMNKVGGEGGAGGGVGGIMAVGKNQSKLYKEDDTGITFADVAGQDEAKESLEEIIDYLHNTEKYNKIGAKLPKGALLVGPPGTGKTLLAKAVAGEAKVPFYSMNGSDFVQMFVGVGASRVRDLFEEAKKNAPCIIFIDEIDAIGKTRDGGVRGGGNDEREQTLNQLLAEMDGFDSTKAIVVLAATNRPEILDKALLRPGRFDRRVIVDKPDLKGRINILQVHIKDVCIDETVDLQAIAHATAGGSGADLANIVNEAALRAVRFNKNAVSQADLMESVEVVFAGKEKKDRVMSEKERKIVAYHEIGHAVVAALQKNSAPVQKITIVPRTMGSLGYTMQIPEEEKYLSTKEEMYEEIRTLLGGRCAEEVIFNTITTGASNDIERATAAAREMITLYGMTEEFDMVAFESIQNRYLDGTPIRNCSDETSTKIDAKMVEIIKGCHKEARDMIANNRELIDELAEYLLEKENITGEEFMDIFIKYYPDAKRPETKEIEKPVKNNILPKEEPIKSKNTESVKNEKNKQQEESAAEKLTKLFKQKTDEMRTNIQEAFSKEEPEVEIIEKENVDIPTEGKEEIIINIPEEIPEPISFDEMEIPPEPSFDEMEIPEIEGVSEPIEDIPMAPDFDFDKKEEPQEQEKTVENKETSESEKEVKKPKYDIKASTPEDLNPRKLNSGKNKSKKKQTQKQTQSSTVKKDDLSSLMNSFKNNPQSLAGKKKKNGIYLDDKKQEEQKKSKLPTVDTIVEDTSSKDTSEDDNITEDMY